MVSSVQNQLINASLLPGQIGNNISTDVAAKSLQASQQQGAGILQLLNAALAPGVTPGDPLVAAATGLGSQLDITA